MSKNISTSEKIQKLERLILGSDSFQQFESMTDQFCPFEATGMISQEIRHSHFLSYILDPNRPHEFGHLLLKELLYLLTENDTENSEYSKLDYHFMELSNVKVFREWKNIDLLIEIPSLNPSIKGAVVCIENKIYASEHGNQLARYEKTTKDKYTSDKWNCSFIYLTIDGALPSKKHIALWQPISLEDVIASFESTIERHKFKDQSTTTFKAYVSMLRRHILKNEDLENLARKIWAEHREALELLNSHKPDLSKKIHQHLKKKHEKFAQDLSKEINFKLVPEISDNTILRFAVENWDKLKKLNVGDNSWVSNNRILIIELTKHREKAFVMSMVIGPGEKSVRQGFYQQVLKNEDINVGHKTKTANKKWKHLSSSVILEREDILDAENRGAEPKDLYEQISKHCVEYLNQDLPVYDKIVKKMFL